MNERSRMERAGPGEHKCEAVGDCVFRAEEGSKYCQKHGAAIELKQIEKKELYSFQKSQFLAQSAEDRKKFDNYKYDLSAELGVARMILQKYLDKVESFQDLQMHNTQIATMMDRIAKISEAVLKADQKLATLMSEEDALSIAQGLLDAVHKILSEHISEASDFASAMENISDAFQKVIDRDASTKN